ncbi:HdeD family acid-resistance protein [Luedemannella flava]|uniref:HdeD family acid-resistance protein n=1 Tax=Luedemannella flava TaxID=349316 RepID=A0ABP4YUD2_9ACTN
MTALPAPPAMRGAQWWFFLITGICWIIIAWVVLRFSLTTVETIAILAGVVILAAGVMEAVHAFTAPGWRWLHGVLAGIFLVTGVVAMLHPGNTFFWLSAFIGWYLLFKGAADVVLAFLTKEENDAWWLLLVVGIIELIFGFWAAGRFERSAYLLIVYVAVIALTHGVTDIVAAFRMRKLAH